MCNHLNLKILIHIFTIIFLITVIIIMRRKTPRWPRRHTGVPRNTDCASLVQTIDIYFTE
jgi:hypothetical protein